MSWLQCEFSTFVNLSEFLFNILSIFSNLASISAYESLLYSVSSQSFPTFLSNFPKLVESSFLPVSILFISCLISSISSICQFFAPSNLLSRCSNFSSFCRILSKVFSTCLSPSSFFLWKTFLKQMFTFPIQCSQLIYLILLFSPL